MRRIFVGVAACSLAVGCSSTGDNSERVQSTSDALDVTLTSGLTRMQGSVASLTNESDREDDTVNHYYPSIKLGIDGVGGASATDPVNGIPTLSQFITHYGFAGKEKVARYYNRGDLGIGREMHCVNNTQSPGFGEVACYVKNFAAGDDNTEFTFGLSSSIAFANMDANHYFATVAMVFRTQASANANKTFFLVYDKNDNLAPAAALDRVGIQFNTAFHGGANPTGFGNPGQNFNNHIPSNCVTCHGGQKYNFINGSPNPGSNRVEVGSLFLPFDPDQFDFDATHPRDETAIRDLNNIVWAVAYLSGPTDLNNSVRNQLNLWYNNTGTGGSLAGNFTQAVPQCSGVGCTPNGCPANSTTCTPGGWNSPDGSALYLNVVRSSCRNCHMTNDQSALHFDSQAQFDAVNHTVLVGDLCSYAMPHSIQSLRQFWQSGQPAALEAYLRSPTGGNDPTNADFLHNCGPGNVATLDPPQLIATLSGLN